MVRSTKIAFAALVVVTLLGQGSFATAESKTTDQAIQEALGDPAPYRQLISELQNALKNHDSAAIAALVSYPISVTVGSKQQTMKSPKDFIANYNAIMTPQIVAATATEAYEDLFVNYQGIMLGEGEIWINGICQDKACKKVDVKVMTIQPRSPLSPPLTPEQLASTAQVKPAKSFKGWVVGCDNLRNCTALGMAPDNDDSAYVRVTRGGGIGDRPKVAITIDIGADAAKSTLKLELNGATTGTVSADPLQTTVDGSLATASLEGDAAAGLIEAMRNATSMSVTILQDAKTGAKCDIPLTGSAAAFLYLDDEQKRVGTETALAMKGSAASSALLPLPVASVVRAVKLTEIPDPLPKRPEGVKEPPADSGCTSDFPDMAIKLSNKLTLWGVCNATGAYNIDYTYWIVGEGKPRLARFNIPGLKTDFYPGTATNLSLADDSVTLNSFAKGRGLGDCGTSADWVWDGEGLRLARYSELDACSGVVSDDWPVLFQAKKE
ncbi:MAG: DUF1176 domain-containing protein [Phyllobacterium sp.]|uniref:DUF1176 domain-containing protein n=1 Tax=Phyllobacterium sp. TaxID=1871046 RepID=UPI0030F012F2